MPPSRLLYRHHLIRIASCHAHLHHSAFSRVSLLEPPELGAGDAISMNVMLSEWILASSWKVPARHTKTANNKTLKFSSKSSWTKKFHLHSCRCWQPRDNIQTAAVMAKRGKKVPRAACYMPLLPSFAKRWLNGDLWQ